jgi:hypothetical protein
VGVAAAATKNRSTGFPALKLFWVQIDWEWTTNVMVAFVTVRASKYSVDVDFDSMFVKSYSANKGEI